MSITMGNAKSVDIYADAQHGVIRVDAKAGQRKGNWPIAKNSVQEDTYYVLVYLQAKNPEYFVVSGKEILSESLIRTWKTRQGITYSSLNTGAYKERWDKLPPP